MKKNWELIAEKNDRIRYIQQKAYSPYSEFSVDGIHEFYEEIEMEMNAFYRYASIMYPMFEKEDVSQRQKEWFFNLFMHYLTDLEFRKGITWQTFECRQIDRAIRTGAYGKEVQKNFENLNNTEQQHILYGVNTQRQIGESVRLFAQSLVRILQDGVVYKNKMNSKELFFYINQKKSNELAGKIKLVEELLMPMDYTLRIFWENHFAVFGQTQTMKLEEIELL